MMSNATTAITGGGIGAGNLNRADSMASSARGGMSDSGHGGVGAQQQQYQGFYPGLPPSLPSQTQIGQVYNPAYNDEQAYAGYGAPHHHQQQLPYQGYAPQYQQAHGGLDYSNSMRRPGGGGYEY